AWVGAGAGWLCSMPGLWLAWLAAGQRLGFPVGVGRARLGRGRLGGVGGGWRGLALLDARGLACLACCRPAADFPGWAGLGAAGLGAAGLGAAGLGAALPCPTVIGGGVSGFLQPGAASRARTANHHSVFCMRTPSQVSRLISNPRRAARSAKES